MNGPLPAGCCEPVERDMELMTERGMTLMELMTVVGLVGIVGGIVAPRVSDAVAREKVRSARNAIVTMHTTARATAIQRARTTTVVLRGDSVLIRSRHPVTGVEETVETPEDLAARYGVTVTATREELRFDPRGLGAETYPTTIVVASGSHADTVTVSAIGRVLR